MAKSIQGLKQVFARIPSEVFWQDTKKNDNGFSLLARVSRTEKTGAIIRIFGKLMDPEPKQINLIGIGWKGVNIISRYSPQKEKPFEITLLYPTKFGLKGSDLEDLACRTFAEAWEQMHKFSLELANNKQAKIEGFGDFHENVIDPISAFLKVNNQLDD